MNDTASIVEILKDPRGHVMDGPCSRCCHCGMGLTDSVSIERGIGPVCSRKGYVDEPREGNDGVAMGRLGSYPELLDYLVERYYKPGGARGFMNGLVRVASLNRGDWRLHEAISNAVEALGWKRLADALRESLAVVEITQPIAGQTEHYVVRVKNRDYKWSFTTDLRSIEGARFSRYPRKCWTVPATQKPALWELLIKHYEGKCGRIIGGTGFRIERKSSKEAA